MQVLRFSDNEREEWLAARRGKITGSKLADIYSTRGNKKVAFYELIAEGVGLPPDTAENAMERGTRLEGDALDRFSEETGKKLDKSRILWMRDDDESIAVSPDGVVLDTPAPDTEAVETKCLSSARHMEVYLAKYWYKLPDADCVPAEYQKQKAQYFIANENLKTLYFAFYDPRFAMFNPDGSIVVGESNKKKLDFFYLTINREDVEAEIEDYLLFERAILEEVREIVNELTSF